MDWLSKHERWIPAATALLWWATFYPGFFGDDSLIHLNDIRVGHVSVWFTAWWVYVVDFVSLNTRAISLLTLVSALVLSYATYLWIAVAFPSGRARALTTAIITACPLIGAMGVHLRHDVPMTAAALICAAVLTRTWQSRRLTALDAALLAAASLMLPTRHNGVPTIAVSAIALWVIDRRRWRQTLALLAAAAAGWLITTAATRSAGNVSAVHPGQTVEWLMGDISCALSKTGVHATAEEWSILGRIAAREEWPQPEACVAVNPMLRSDSFSMTAVVDNYDALIDTWLSITRRHPAAVVAAHASRVRLHLPPFLPGRPEVVSFLHSTILPNDFGLEWKFPALAERARMVVRAWNAASFVVANSAVWLLVVAIAAWKLPAYRPALVPATIIGVVLNAGLLAAAPISEGRYGLFILITGQASALFLAVAGRAARPPRREALPTDLSASR